MEKHIPGHTGKQSYKEAYARKIAKHNKFKKDLRPYICHVGGESHWHVTSMSKGRYYTSQRKDPRTSRRAFNLPD